MSLPITARTDAHGHLEIGGCDCCDLAAQFGTPLYVFDEATLRDRCRAFRAAFERRHPDSRILYAGKAFLNRAVAQIIAEEGLGLDVVSGGEMAVARAAGFPPDRVCFHGNNKSLDELQMALDWGVGRIAVDNFHELALLGRLAAARDRPVEILLRLAPGVEPRTHAHISTGGVASKFGFPIADGQAEAAVQAALTTPGLRLLGLHAHIGSQIHDLAPYGQTVRVMVEFAAQMAERHGMHLAEISPGGGWAIRTTPAEQAPTPEEIAEAIVDTLHNEVARHGLPLPRLTVEPGRAIIGPAGVALYTVGARKEVPGGPTYVFVDGGMADNIRPALYGARYQAIAASRANEPPSEMVTIAGRYCESGDILIRDAALPHLVAGDLLAVPAVGAYCLSLASNYNLARRPAVVLVHGGQAHLIRRREEYEDLLRLDAITDH